MKPNRKIQDRIRAIAKLREAVLTAIFADDRFLRTLALKGGSALELAYGIGARTSVDIDLSHEGAFVEDNATLEEYFSTLLKRRFDPDGIVAFDLHVEPRPPELSPDLVHFWGGNSVTFRLIESDKYQLFVGDLDRLRREAMLASISGSTKMEIDISNHECLDAVDLIDMDGYLVPVYRPISILYEKLRAICQQTEEYGVIIKRARRGAQRAKDFFDIEVIRQTYPQMDLLAPESLGLLGRIFEIKRVPLHLLRTIGDDDQRAFHSANWKAVLSTVPDPARLQPFNHYFDRTATLGRSLYEALRIPDPPSI